MLLSSKRMDSETSRSIFTFDLQFVEVRSLLSVEIGRRDRKELGEG